MAQLAIKKNAWIINFCEIEVTKETIEEIKDLITDFLLELKTEKSASQIIKAVLKKYYNVSAISILTQNKFYLELVNFVNMHENQKKFALACLDPETNSIVMKTKYYKFKDKNATIENLKNEIKNYIRLYPNDIKIRNIIFNSLESLTGYKANRHVTKYHENGITNTRTENSIYTMLVSFVESLPEYKENYQRVKNSSKIRKDKEKIDRIIQNQQDFLDKKYELDLCQVFRHSFLSIFKLPHLNLFQFLHQNRYPVIYLV